MRKFSGILVLCLGLAACTVTEKPRPGSSDSGGEVSKARSAAVALCGFLPTVQTIVDILELGVPALSKGSKIAKAVCEKITEGKKGGKVPRVNGVRIRGDFV